MDLCGWRPPAAISVLSAGILKRMSSADQRALTQLIDELGTASARAQGLGAVITTYDKLVCCSEQRLYLCVDRAVMKGVGLLKVGVKKLFIRTVTGSVKEIEPLCCLDFYVHESQQRKGIGQKMFIEMLAQENSSAERMAYDRPSEKLLPFLRKNFGLSRYVAQPNNYVVFEQYFQNRPPSARRNHESVSNRPLTREKRGRRGRNSQRDNQPREQQQNYHQPQQQQRGGGTSVGQTSSGFPFEPVSKSAQNIPRQPVQTMRGGGGGGYSPPGPMKHHGREMPHFQQPAEGRVLYGRRQGQQYLNKDHPNRRQPHHQQQQQQQPHRHHQQQQQQQQPQQLQQPQSQHLWKEQQQQQQQQQQPPPPPPHRHHQPPQSGGGMGSTGRMGQSGLPFEPVSMSAAERNRSTIVHDLRGVTGPGRYGGGWGGGDGVGGGGGGRPPLHGGGQNKLPRLNGGGGDYGGANTNQQHNSHQYPHNGTSSSINNNNNINNNGNGNGGGGGGGNGGGMMMNGTLGGGVGGNGGKYAPFGGGGGGGGGGHHHHHHVQSARADSFASPISFPGNQPGFTAGRPSLSQPSVRPTPQSIGANNTTQTSGYGNNSNFLSTSLW
eukprot:COSAG05_NODE_3034_length_2397_cov_97.630983_2_plen_606_part_00